MKNRRFGCAAWFCCRVIWRNAEDKGVKQCEQLIWQALLAKGIWMCSMDVLMGDLEEGRQQRSEAMTVNGCEVDVKCEWQQEGGVFVWWRHQGVVVWWKH